MELPEKLQNTVDFFSKIPGVGPKTAVRHALYLARWNHQDLQSFSASLSSLASINQCKECGLYCDDEICHICSSEDRKSSGFLCVVENITDCLAIEKSRTFRGTYHVLGGVLNPLMGIGPDELGIDRLLKRCESGVTEVILAVSSSVEGDATSSYIREKLPNSVNVERIGFGIPMGGSLEYLDPLTITKALENRKRMD